MIEDFSTAAFHSLWAGIEQFNQGEFYACHDTLEAIWMVAPTQEKPFFQGILQIAVALYHLSHHNWQGAAILLGEGTRRLEPFEPSYRDVDVSDLLDRADLWFEALQQLGPDRVTVLAAALAHPDQGTLAIEAMDSLPALHIRRATPNLSTDETSSPDAI